ncbi:ribonuclease Y [Dialister sp. CAG:588]|nr:ribonuclease Y [Dialister sp. CAG:588]
MGTLIYLYEIFIEKSKKEREVTSLELGKIMLFMCITFLVAGLIGCGIGYILRKRLAEAKIESAEEKARQIAIDAQRLLDNTSREAQNLKKEAMMQTREEIHKLREDVEKQNRERRDELQKYEQRLIQKEEHLERRSILVEEREDDVNKKTHLLQTQQEEVEKVYAEQRAKLEEISQMTQSEARTLILDKVDADLTHEKAVRIREAENDIKMNSDQVARKILAAAIQRNAADTVSETTVSVVSLPNEEMKGRIIGREGRNIRAIETLTGVDLIIDDTPEAVILSCFNPVRREIARVALEALVKDGRIHPARIEEVVEKAKKEVEKAIMEAGEAAVLECGIRGIHPELIKTLGKLRYRTSYGQNVLQHSIDVAYFAGVLAAEVGANIDIAKRAGLLHDIGKAVDREREGTHVELGVEIAKRYHEPAGVVDAIASHHGDVEAQYVESVLVAAADAVSAARPGARRETLENYIKRLTKLEDIAKSYSGVENCYAIQAGRELRVLVKPEKVTEDEAVILSHNVAQQIENELQYPGQVKVVVIRETRATDYAK